MYVNSGFSTLKWKSILKKCLAGTITTMFESYSMDTSMEFIKNYNNLFLQTVDLLKRNPTEEVVLRHLETRRRMTKLETLQLILPKEILTNVNITFPSQSSIEEATPLSEENSSTDSLSNINNESNKDR